MDLEEAQAKLSWIAAAEAISSSDEKEQDMAPPDKIEVDNDFSTKENHNFPLSLGDY